MRKRNVTHKDILREIKSTSKVTNEDIKREIKISSRNNMFISILTILFATYIASLGFYINRPSVEFFWLSVILLLAVALFSGLMMGLGVGQIIKDEIQKRKKSK